jgi:serine protease Do
MNATATWQEAPAMKNRIFGIVLVLAALTGGAILYQRSISPVFSSPATILSTPAPTDPAQATPAPSDPAPSDPAPTDPAQVTPTPTDPATQAAPASKPSSTGIGAGFDYGRARLEDERNNIDVAYANDSSVVFITTKIESTPTQTDPNDPFGFMQQQQQQSQQGNGSGFVISDDGLILTNNHVVTLESDTVGKLSVRFHGDRRTYPAKLVGRAIAYDVALIKVDAPGKKFKAIPLGDSDTVKVGQKAIAMGNPFGLEFSVTSGIISATGRNFGSDSDNLAQNVIQTDAAVNPGNSGGPLLNSSAEVIGINTAILSPGTSMSGTGQFAGIAFAVPINLVKRVLPDLKAGKTLSRKEIMASRPRLGISGNDLGSFPPEVLQQFKLPASGVMIERVEAGSPAEAAGLRGATKYAETQQGSLAVNGDIILEVEGQTIESTSDLRGIVTTIPPGSEVNLKIKRGNETLEIKAKVAVIPEKK